MDFSKPDNARLINRLKALSVIREKKNISRAELSRELLISKVSISEIVDSLIKDGLVKESGKISPVQGRPAKLLDIDVRSGKVIAITIGRKGCLIAASDLKGKILRLERFSRGKNNDEMKENLSSSLSRILRSENIKIYGAVIASDEDVSFLSDIIPFDIKVISRTEAQVRAEKREIDSDLSKMLFLMISDDITGYYNGLVLNDLGRLPVVFEGATITLSDLISSEAIRAEAEKRWGESLPVKEILRRDEFSQMIKSRISPLSTIIANIALTLSSDSAMIIGELSDLKDEHYAALNDEVIKQLDSRGNFIIYKSIRGESGIIEGACLHALDHFFYKKELLEKLKEIESL